MVMAGEDDIDSTVDISSAVVDGCVAVLRKFCLPMVFAATVSIDACKGLVLTVRTRSLTEIGVPLIVLDRIWMYW